MAHLRRHAQDYQNDGWTYVDYDEKKGSYGQINKPLHKLDVNTVTSEAVSLGAGAAATTGKFSLGNNAAILTADGSMVGHYFSGTDNNTSLVHCSFCSKYVISFLSLHKYSIVLENFSFPYFFTSSVKPSQEP